MLGRKHPYGVMILYKFYYDKKHKIMSITKISLENKNDSSCISAINISKSRVLKTTIKKIAEYWIENTNIHESELNFDWADAYTNCWNCGDDKYSKSQKKVFLQRCHIIPHALGGSDTPNNYVLLCKQCHAEAPNIANTDDMWDWIKSNRVPYSIYGTYRINKALIMFEQREGESFFEKIVKKENFDIKNVNNLLSNSKNTINSHGFDKYNVSSWYYLLKHIAYN